MAEAKVSKTHFRGQQPISGQTERIANIKVSDRWPTYTASSLDILDFGVAEHAVPNALVQKARCYEIDPAAAEKLRKVLLEPEKG
jgi:hypothetical protein